MPTGSWSADQNLTFKLNECTTGDPAAPLKKWDNGKHYIYTLNFNIKGATGENEILIKTYTHGLGKMLLLAASMLSKRLQIV